MENQIYTHIHDPYSLESRLFLFLSIVLNCGIQPQMRLKYKCFGGLYNGSATTIAAVI
jgi:hypothetical protein